MLTVSHCPWVYNCVGVNTHRHFFLYLVFLTLGILVHDWLLVYCKPPLPSSPPCLPPDFRNVSPSASEECNVLSASLCQYINADSFTVTLGLWMTLQLTWVTMLIFTQFFQLSRAMTTYENMYGVHDASLMTPFTSTGTPLDPTVAPVDPAPSRHKHAGGGTLKQWSRLLGVDPFIETIAGRGAANAAKGGKRQKKKNPYSRGCVVNCKDFWCDPSPVFGERENGMAVLDGEKVDYTAMYESPALMRLSGMRDRGGYEVVEEGDV